MSQIYAPYGFRPVGILGQEYNTNGFSEYPLTSDNPATAMSVGDPVAIVNGSIAPVTAAAAAGTLSVNTPLGIIWGFTYIDSMGKIWEAPYLPAAAISAGALKSISCKVVDDPNALMYLCPNAPSPLPTTCIGQNAGYTNFGVNGLKTNSTVALDVSSIAVTATLPLRIVRIDRPDDLFPDVVVKWNFGAHYYMLGAAH